MIGPPVPSDLDQASSAAEHNLTFRLSQAQRSLLHSAAIQQLQSLHTASDAAAEQLPSNSACPAPPSFGRSEGHGGAVPVAFGSIEIHVLP
jgi:D-alanyl-D-alanine dipeptidase